MIAQLVGHIFRSAALFTTNLISTPTLSTAVEGGGHGSSAGGALPSTDELPNGLIWEHPDGQESNAREV